MYSKTEAMGLKMQTSLKLLKLTPNILTSVERELNYVYVVRKRCISYQKM